MRALLRLVQLILALAAVLLPTRALADKVLVLPFTSVGQATSKELDDARVATKSAVAQKGHTLPSDSEVLSAQMATKDGVADTSQEYRAAGRASGSQWTVAGRVDPRGATYRLELEAGQVDSGRVESLAREIEPSDAVNQIGEMLALLLRPEGIANADIPWKRGQPKPQPPKPAAPPTPPLPPPPPPPPAVKHTYAEGHPIAVGAGVALTGAVSRPQNAMGPGTALLVAASGGYALDAVPGLEIRGDVAGSVLGPGSILADAGARYAIAVAPTARLFAGPEATVGAFFPTGGDRSARFYARGSAFVALGLGDRVQIEASGDFAAALGGSSALVFAGGALRGLVRF